MRKMLFCVSVIVLTFFISFNAQAYLYYQPPLTSSSSGSVSSATGPFGESHVYDDFMLTSSSSLSTITWWGFYYDTKYLGNPSFTVTFYADNNGSPDFSSQISTSVTGSLITLDAYKVVDERGQDLWVKVYSIGLTTQEFSANTRYWLSIYNGDSDSSWGWQQANATSGFFSGDLGALQDGDSISDVAFQLKGTSEVPIPTAAWLLALGLIGLAVVRRRIKR